MRRGGTASRPPRISAAPRLRPRADLPDDPRGPFRPEQRFGLGEADPFGGAQPREEVFVEAVPFGKGFASGFGAPDVLRNGSDVPVTFPPVERVGGGADAQILRAVPVCGVVAGAGIPGRAKFETS